MIRSLSAVLATLCLATLLSAADEPAEFIKVKSDGEYKVVTPPIKALDDGKTLDVMVRGVLVAGVVAIGGETTGLVIKVGKTTWELDIADDPKLLATVKEQNGKPVVVTGKVTKKAGVEVKFRTIVKVEGLKAGK